MTVKTKFSLKGAGRGSYLELVQTFPLASLKSEDRVILIPSDVALLWRHLGRMNLGAESVFDF